MSALTDAQARMARHLPYHGSDCRCCGTPWPCDAYVGAEHEVKLLTVAQKALDALVWDDPETCYCADGETCVPCELRAVLAAERDALRAATKEAHDELGPRDSDDSGERDDRALRGR